MISTRKRPTATQTTPQTREAYEEEAGRAGSSILHDLNWFELDTPQERDREDAYGPEDERRTALPQGRATRGTAPKGERTRRSLSYGGLGDTSRGADYGHGIGGSSLLAMVCDYGVLCFPQ